MSRNFTDFEAFTHPPAAGAGLCPVCTWAYTHSPLRESPHLITRTPPGLTVLDRAGVGHLLNGPITTEVALMVPLRPGRKHLAALTRWGTVTTDDTTLTWTTGDAARLHAMTRLRGAGVTAAELHAAALPHGVMTRTDPTGWAQLTADFDALHPWRRRPPWLRLALYATTPATTPTPATAPPARSRRR